MFGRVFFLHLFLFSLLASANVPIRPQTIAELGIGDYQLAYRVPVKVRWLNLKALRRDYPVLRGKSRRAIEKIITETVGVVTHRQKLLEGVFTTPIQVLTDSKGKPLHSMVFHPEDYGRSAIASTVVDGQTLLFDFKMSGYSNGLEHRSKHNGSHSSFEWLYSFLDFLKEKKQMSPEVFEDWLKDWNDSKTTDEKKLSETSVDDLNRKSLFRDIRGKKERIQLATLALQWVQKLQEPRTEAASYALDELEDKIILTLRSQDYTNGTAKLDRLYKEVVAQNITQFLFDEQYELTGVREETVESYFLLEHEFRSIDEKGNLHRLGILGRQTHWRNSSLLKEHTKHPNFDKQFSRIEEGGLQYGIFGEMVDFELHEIDDRRLPQFAMDESLDSFATEITKRSDGREMTFHLERILRSLSLKKTTEKIFQDKTHENLVRAFQNGEETFIHETPRRALNLFKKYSLPENLKSSHWLEALLCRMASQAPQNFVKIAQAVINDDLELNRNTAYHTSILPGLFTLAQSHPLTFSQLLTDENIFQGGNDFFYNLYKLFLSLSTKRVASKGWNDRLFFTPGYYKHSYEVFASMIALIRPQLNHHGYEDLESWDAMFTYTDIVHGQLYQAAFTQTYLKNPHLFARLWFGFAEVLNWKDSVDQAVPYFYKPHMTFQFIPQLVLELENPMEKQKNCEALLTYFKKPKK